MGKLIEGTKFQNSGRDPDSLELDEKSCLFSDRASDLSRHNHSEDLSDEFENDPRDDSIKRTVFWESQEALLQEILERYVSVNIKLREEIERIIEEAKNTDFCSCEKPKSDDGCINCFRKTVVKLLRQKGYNAKLCTSKWKSTKEIPGGMHEYIQVIVNTHGRKKQIPVLIEPELRDQFKIAKACNEYQKLVNQLPEYYIGKFDYLNAIITVLCEAAKQSMKEKKLYRGPWRKRKFMEMKWSGCSEGGPIDCSSDDKDRRSCLEVSAAPAVAVI